MKQYEIHARLTEDHAFYFSGVINASTKAEAIRAYKENQPAGMKWAALRAVEIKSDWVTYE